MAEAKRRKAEIDRLEATTPELQSQAQFIVEEAEALMKLRNIENNVETPAQALERVKKQLESEPKPRIFKTLEQLADEGKVERVTRTGKP